MKTKHHFLVCFLTLFIDTSSAASNNLRFEHLNVEQGLSQSTVNSIHQDYKGFLWIGTADGLNRYDGYEFKTFRSNPLDTQTISSNRINSIFEDSDSTLWIGTSLGLNRFNQVSEVFTRYLFNPSDSTSISNNNITKIFEDRKGNLWIGTISGLNLFIRKYDCFLRFNMMREYHSGPKSLKITDLIQVGEDLWIGTENSGILILNLEYKTFNVLSLPPDQIELTKNITALHAEDDSLIWIGTNDHGLFKYKVYEKRLSRSDDIIKKDPILNNSDISSILRDANDHLWIGTFSNSLYQYLPESKKLIHHTYTSKNLDGISYNVVHTIFEDKSNVLWIGTNGGGINKVKKVSRFIIYRSEPDNVSSLNHNVVTSIYQNNTDIWVGTDAGLNYINYKRRYIEPNYISGDRSVQAPVYSIVKDDDDNVWIGTYGNGVSGFYYPGGEKRQKARHKLGKLRHVSDKVLVSYIDNAGNMWIGSDSDGLYLLDKDNYNRFEWYKNIPGDENSISDNTIWSIYESPSEADSIIWIGTAAGGLNKFTRKTKTFIHYKYENNNPQSLSANRVYVIHEDKKGNFWIGTNGGLNKFNRKSEIFESYGTWNGLPNDVIYGILEDDNQFLWLSTNSGLVRFNPNTKGIERLTRQDGLPSDEFNARAFFRNHFGDMFFGCLEGLVQFNPDKVLNKENTFKPPIQITNLQLLNEKVKTGSSILPVAIDQCKEIHLPYHKNMITFEFAALEYTNPANNQYAYKLKGLNQDWVYTSADRRFATYTNLDPGTYTFMVKASNNDGYWNEKGKSLDIIIHPPWFRTTTAYVSYIIIFLMVILWIRSYELKRLALRNESRKLKELDEMKSRFFANISHEFRTPLTLILGPTQQLLDLNLASKLTKQLNLIQRNAIRLQKLINQLLDLSRLESGKLQLKLSKIDIIAFTKTILASFESLGESRNIKLGFKSNLNELVILLDSDIYEKIITNLLSNALKFSDDGTEICINISNDFTEISSVKQGYCCIKVQDQGIGIDQKNLPHIFERFYQVDFPKSRNYEGSGIGLALVKELVELHRGTIKVRSLTGKGSTFTVCLPAIQEHYSEQDIFNIADKANNSIDRGKSAKIVKPVMLELQKNPQFPLLLIVEDNQDVQQYLEYILGNEYNLIFAENGEKGIKKAVEHIPDVIVSDIMMPQMDGIEMCGRLKGDVKTSHIPILLLTARAGQENKLLGLHTGADDYLIKPFDVEELRVRIHNIIENRKKLQAKFEQMSPFKLQKLDINEKDKSFLSKAVNMIKINMADPAFNAEKFASEMSLSRAQLFRKLRSLTGKSITEFIRHIRIQEAAVLLKNRQGNVSEVAFEVGFNNLSYFTENFKKQFGVLPSEYI